MMKFITDGMCGGLARWLRLIGYDTLYFNIQRKIELIRIAEKEKRIILTKDKKFAEKYPEIVFYIEGEDTYSQFKEVVKKFDLEIKEENLFKRCSICNTKLEEITKEKVKNRVPEYVYQNKEKFALCSKCNKIYWEGDHCKYIRERLRNL
ncbi:MAG: Mut7-C RNAse domain-containing protein [Candidatus Omnitrophica bacterium]|nr:Mut7-C RNAse domain-containing protein [Candidatus Omnitrophota bacterium]MCM8809582.1 Mut7-C RNAse domain-containing protein [Candidatus Omnitrophota bacterium]MCM8810268.1 Mut7-C RNAse domain-containing protein [Candidatus Omnitrophota bacterium]MCM8832556.1 Mut7-C RNAse domain-containing protein [Candidatus Omnitrophota bacterium]